MRQVALSSLEVFSSETTMKPNDVRIYPVVKWEEFGVTLRDKIFQFGSLYPGETIYRGHARRDWKLSSPLERVLYEPIPVGGEYRVQRNVDLENRVIKHFRNFIGGTPGVQTDTLSDEELEALGRHHWLCTALLDWTRSPYVAVYFAFMETLELDNPGLRAGRNKTKDLKVPSDPVAIWGLTLAQEIHAAGGLIVGEWRKDAFYRQRAQQGLFTRLKSEIFVDIESYLKNIGCAHFLSRIEIPGSEAATTLLDLHAMNIHEASLFPDAHGAAIQANLQLRWSELLSLSYRGR